MDKALKQRLVGATVLVVLAVILLPMLLSGPVEPGTVASQPIELPPRPGELQFETRRFPVGSNDQGSAPPAPPRQTPDPVDRTAAVATPEVPGPESSEDMVAEHDSSPGPEAQVESDVAPALVQDSPGEGAPAEEPAAGPGGPESGRFLVQVASFSSPANADRLAKRLRGDDFPVMLDTVESAAGTLHRVRVGPYAVEYDARDTLQRLATLMPDLNPRLLDLQPEQGAPVAAPPDPMARWVVQVGSFASSDNAQGLVDRLRRAGYAASSVTVREGASTAYRVRVGPEIERDAAVRIADELQQQHGLAGLVMESD